MPTTSAFPGTVPCYQFTEDFKVTPEIKEAFDTDGCVLLRGVLDQEEIDAIVKGIKSNDEFFTQAHGVADDTGRAPICPYGLSQDLMSQAWLRGLIGGEIYHYHTKLMMKNAQIGGRHVWHQDYGYWYNLCVLKPEMMTVFIAVDDCRKENGCLQVLKGTHHCGRMDHVQVGGQQGCDLERLEYIKANPQFEHVFAEMNKGDALYFHCNLLHASSENDSQMRRWAFLVAYNRRDNNPYKENTCPRYTPLEMVSNDAIRNCTNFTDLSGKHFYEVEADPNVNVTRADRQFLDQ